MQQAGVGSLLALAFTISALTHTTHRKDKVPLNDRGLGLDCQLQLRACRLAIAPALPIGIMERSHTWDAHVGCMHTRDAHVMHKLSLSD
jgi:hypothetical protein